MPFAIKVIKEHDEGLSKNKTTERYYSQTLETLGRNGFEKLVLLTDGSEPDEIDISRSLEEAEVKATLIKSSIRSKFVYTKVVEYPTPKSEQDD